MYRITIKWDSIIPLFKSVSGIVKIEKFETSGPNTNKYLTITKFRARCKPGILSYTAIDGEDGIPTAIFNALKPKLETAIRAYQRGVALDDTIYMWQTKEDYKESYEELDKLFSKEDDYKGA
jgi:hypothetical protein